MEIPLEKVLISPKIAAIWTDYASFLANELYVRYGTKAVVSDEKFRILPCGNGELYVIEAGRIMHRLFVPMAEFQII